MMRFAPAILKSPLPLAMIAALAFAHSAAADTLNLNYTATSPDGTVITQAVINAGISTPAATSVSTYAHTLPNLSYAVPGSSSLANPAGFEFYDDYVFSIGGSSLSSITATIDLANVSNIAGLNVRLFSWSGTNEQSGSTVTIGSVPTLLQAWTYATGSGQVAVIDQSNVAAGTYVLQVRGNVSGTGSLNTYVGQLNVTPVPLPAALPLLLSGFGLLGGLFARRRQAV